MHTFSSIGAVLLAASLAMSAWTWKTPKIRAPANCSACHAGAERGEFDEHAARLPR